MEKCLNNKTVVVTGGAQGIGFDIAKKFLESGAKLAILVDINDDKGRLAEKEISNQGHKAIFIKCDVTKDLEEVFGEISLQFTLDVLVNSAGIADESVPKRIIDVNLTAAIDWSFKFWNYMQENNIAGTIINISSIFGLRITPMCPIYLATKFGLTGFSRSLGHAWYKKHGVRVISLCPGLTETNLFLEGLRKKDIENDFLTMIKSQEWQKVGAVGDAAVDVFERGSSGSVWVIEGGKLNEELL